MTDTAIDTETLVAALRRHLANDNDHRRAAVELLIAHDHWLRTARFRAAAVTVTEDGAYISWSRARDAFEAGDFDRSLTSERAVLDFAIALGEDRYRLGNMGRVHREWIVRAVTTAVGLDA